MPTSVLLLLSAVVGVYILFVFGTAVAFFRAQRSAPSTSTSEAPFLSIVIPASSDASLDDLLDTLRTSDYPADRYEVLVAPPDETGRSAPPTASFAADREPSVRVIETDASPGSGAPSESIADDASGDVLVRLPPHATLSPEWLSAVAAHAGPETRRLATAVTYEHNDRFLPRLQALEQVGRTAAAVGVRRGFGGSTRDAPPSGASSPAETVSATAAPEAQVQRPAPAASLGAYVEATAQRFRHTIRRSGRGGAFAVSLYWLTHALFLVTGTVAVALPAWRQPVLLAFLAKMGADLVLAVPAARHFGQRGLLRSIVPAELFLVLAVPASGFLGAWTHVRDAFRSD